jgi:RHS repeat-associated protein
VGTLVNTYSYDSYGKLLASTGTTPNPLQYTAREFDAETGAYYYRARYYDQNVGRFNSEDPIGFEGGIDFYRYVGNSVVNRTDPDGMGAADCLKALEKWALAYANVQERLGLFKGYGDQEHGHAQSLEEALNHLNNATDEVKRKCNCDVYKAEVLAVVSAAAALADRVSEALSQFSELCAEDPEVCLVF